MSEPPGKIPGETPLRRGLRAFQKRYPRPLCRARRSYLCDRRGRPASVRRREGPSV